LCGAFLGEIWEKILNEEITRRLVPFPRKVELLTTIRGVNAKSTEVILAEIGVDLSRSLSAARLASWAGMCPGNHESAGIRLRRP
jgi:transposase